MIERRDFETDLEQSRAHANDPLWNEVYRKAFPDFYHRIIVTEEHLQHQGIDSVVLLKSGAKLNIDEKVRNPRYRPDRDGILLEEWSSVRERINGWWRAAKQTDYLAYAFLSTQQCFMVPFHALRKIRAEYGQKWLTLARERRDGFQQVNAATQRGLAEWETFSIAVPIPVLMKAVNNVLEVSWREHRTAQPDFAAYTCIYPVGNHYCGRGIPTDAMRRLCEEHSP